LNGRDALPPVHNRKPNPDAGHWDSLRKRPSSPLPPFVRCPICFWPNSVGRP